MCNRLQNWGLGRLMPTITSNRRYRIHPMAPTTFDSRVAKTFSSVFHEQIKSVVEYLNLEESKRKEKIKFDYEQNKIQKESISNEDKKKSNETSINIKNDLNDDNNTVGNNQHDETSKNMKSRTSQFFHSSTSSSNFKIPSTSNVSSGSLFNFSNINNRSKNEIEVKNNIKRCNAASDNNNNDNNNDSNPTHSNHSNIHRIDNNAFYGIRSPTYHVQELPNEVKSMRRSTLNICDAPEGDDKIIPSNATGSPKGIERDTETETVEYGLPSILAVFDGHHNLEHSIKKLPLPLHPFGVDIVVWLLR